MADNPRLVHLEDKQGNPVAPATVSKGVMMDYGVDVQTQVDYFSVEHIQQEKIGYLADIGDCTSSAVTDVQVEGKEYRDDIDTLQEEVDAMDATVFPLRIEYVVRTDFNTYTNNISAEILEYDTGTPGITGEYIEKWANGTYKGKIYDPISYTSSISTSTPIEGSKERYVFHAETKNKSTHATYEKYLWFYGVSKSKSMTSDIAMSLNKVLTTGVAFNPTITTHYGDYIWFIVPNYLSINQVKSSGFDVTLNDYELLQVGTFGTYKAYRTLNALDDATWSLVIS